MAERPAPAGGKAAARPGPGALPHALLALTIFIWASNNIFAKSLVAETTPITLSFLRWAFATAMVLPFGLPHVVRQRALVRRHLRQLLLLAALGVGIFSLLVYTGLRYTSAINAVILNTAVPALILLAAWIILGDRPTGRQGVGIAICAMGTLAIVLRGDPAVLLTLSVNVGDPIFFFAMVLWAIYTVLVKRLPGEFTQMTLLTVSAVLGVLWILPVFLAHLWVAPPPLPLTVDFWLWVLYLGFFPSVVGYLLWQRGVQAVGPATAGAYTYLFPVFGIVLAYLHLGERLHLYHAVGVGLIFAGLWLVIGRQRRAVSGRS